MKKPDSYIDQFMKRLEEISNFKREYGLSYTEVLALQLKALQEAKGITYDDLIKEYLKTHHKDSFEDLFDED